MQAPMAILQGWNVSSSKINDYAHKESTKLRIHNEAIVNLDVTTQTEYDVRR